MEKKKRRRGKKLNLLGEEAGKAQFFGTGEVMAAQARADEKDTKAEQEKLDKEKRKEDAKVTKAVKEALAEQEKLKKAEQKEINTQVRSERKKQEVLDRAIARKQATEAKKAAKKAKPSRIIILRAGSSILANISTQEEVVVEEPITKAVVVPQTTRSGRQIILPQRYRN
jgi:Skp family chaperone for outer membrane proteins